MKPHFLSAMDPTHHALTIAATGAVLAGRVEIGGNSQQRRRGLLGRDGLEAEHGFVIAPCQGVHTFGMRFAIDIVAVRRDGTVVKLRPNVRPRRLVFSLSAFAIIECAAGTIDRAGVRVGDRLVVGVV